MEKIIFFGKGGIGKSTIASNLAVTYARRGLRVLLIGCDPKHDTTLSLTKGAPIKTLLETPGFMDLARSTREFIVRGDYGIDCVEAGGPEPGVGCAGRGISRLIEVFEHSGVLAGGAYDAAIFDVLGDVVCGGFAAPLRMGFADKVCIVASEELMSLYAANNIARAVKNNEDNRVSLCGLVVNLRDPGADVAAVRRFARLIGTRVLAFMPRDPAVRKAEFSSRPAVELSPRSPFSREVRRLGRTLLAIDAAERSIPNPLPDAHFSYLALRGFRPEHLRELAVETIGGGPEAPPAAGRGRWGGSEGRASRAEPPPAEAPADDPGLESRLLEAFRGSYGRPGPKWQGVDNSLQWNPPGQWRRFICDLEEARNFEEQLLLYAPALHIRHEDLECHYAASHQNDGLPYFFVFPWFAGRPTAQSYHPVGGSICTNLDESDVLLGTSRKLEETVESAVKAMARKVPLFVSSTCLPTAVGDDLMASLRRLGKKHGVEIHFANPAAQQFSHPVRDWFVKEVDKLEPGSVRPDKKLVNLIGFPATDSTDEVVGLLESIGLKVNTPLLPRIDPASARRFVAAGLSVLYPEPGFEPHYAELKPVFDQWRMTTVSPPPPYGFRGTAAWLGAVAARTGADKAALARLAAALKEGSLRSRRDAASSPACRLGFVLDAHSMRRLCSPQGFHGVPLLTLLKELGFGLDLLVYAEGSRPRPAVKEPGLNISWFKTEPEMRRLLERGTFQAVYSEFCFDGRLASAGKSRWSVMDVEMGPEGARRTAERLRKLCGWSFYADYRRYLGDA
ncbi:MAG: AAA family ATPase [Elusimicrobia bacterium]|nr:AAA family ATPase [Elusimicrobiota bacterium]